TSVDFVDHNQLANERFYQSDKKNSSVVRVSTDVSKLKPIKYISLLKYSALCFLIFSALAVLFFIIQKFVLKKTSDFLNPKALFFAIPITLLIMLIGIRIMTIGELGRFLVSPLASFPLLLKACLQDFIYAAILTV